MEKPNIVADQSLDNQGISDVQPAHKPTIHRKGAKNAKARKENKCLFVLSLVTRQKKAVAQRFLRALCAFAP